MTVFRALLLIFCATLVSTAGADERYAYEIDLKPNKSGTFYVHGRLSADVETDLLVDTGSSYVALSRRTFRRLTRHTPAVHLRDVRGTMASGKSAKIPIYRIPTLAIGERCVLRDVEVAVMPGANRDILGLSALRQMQPFALTMAPPRLLFTECSGPESLAAASPVSETTPPRDQPPATEPGIPEKADSSLLVSRLPPGN